MWYLEAFDNDTELLAGEYLLREMSVEIVKEILDIDDSDFELPVGIRQNDVPLEKVPEFAKYINEPFKIDQNCEYEVAFLTE
ncbi:hypothetical protein CJ178_03030 [Rhodococcus sp. ACPA4]|jgi:hypothetical protein|uniref:DUF7683 domain-containing protein n=1 Tax=Nocardia globerula TaxID=1818 RepID=A0A652YK86_NOCGL|nr:hypothetical protein SZ00_02999 [Rhodococcus sp. AD45]PBC40710.1 hypothetical protein CJ178_03030 [Rhodococcus sp. ACPA4]PSR39991.1 hypothetical protein C7T36_20400 [Rhodococcus sp. AD45-ID]PVX66038.1 hypothetical protein C8E04_3358 [Rhodococcus globerulus]ROZ46140.1 hypothetical protein EEB13_18115 [Rhodococcus sp. WS3]